MLKIVRWVRVTTEGICANGRRIDVKGSGAKLLVSAYKSHIGEYPKFFKMDALCRLGFIASEILLKGLQENFAERDDCAVVLFNAAGSYCNDSHYEATISDRENYFPSPSVFVYTLPNIVTGEICIRHKLYGESSFYVLDELNEQLMTEIVNDTFQDGHTRFAVCGWTEAKSDDDFYALLMLVTETESTDYLTFKENNIKQIE